MKSHIHYIALCIGALLCACGANSGTSDKGVSDVPVGSAVENVSAGGFNADSAYRFVSEQLAFGPRNPGSEGHARCAAYLVGKLHGFGADTVIVHSPEIEIPYCDKRVKLSNILARYNVSSPKRILLLAHWDTRPVADRESEPALKSSPIPGANDGGSGVGVLLEIARNLKNSNPAYGVDILFVDAEDSGTDSDDNSWCLGTQEWLKTYPAGVPGVYAPEFAVLLDMVGGKDAVFHREYFSDTYAREATDKVWGAAARAGHASRFPNRRGSAINDDHLVLNRGGIPAVDIIENSNPATGSFNPSWHTHADNLSGISKETLRAAGETVEELITFRK